MKPRRRAFFATTIGARLLFMVLAPALVGGLLVFGLFWHSSQQAYQRLLTQKVNSDLALASQHLAGSVTRLRLQLAALAAANGSLASAPATLARLRAASQLDFLYELPLTSPSVAGQNAWPVVQQAAQGEAASALDLLDAEAMRRIDPALTERARLQLLPTAHAAPDQRHEETRGMFIHAAAPLFDSAGKVRAVLVGGILLNGNLAYVDAINSLVYPAEALPPGSHGTATIFLDDARIATNVRLPGDTRAIGTRVSSAVRRQVLEEGRSWRDRAFVVSDYYVSGYAPLNDSFGQRIGMIYVGFLEAPLRAASRQTLFEALAGFALIGALLVFWALHRVRRIMQPVVAMQRAIGAIEGGAPGARAGKVDSADELAQLAGEFDRLLDHLDARQHRLQDHAASLGQKVRARGKELRAASEELHNAQHRLLKSERLAAIGELTAGVAHEINNPLAVIQGNLDVLCEVLGEQRAPVDDEIRLINEQISRIRTIITKLLQFARPGEFAGYAEKVDSSAALLDCLLLARHHLEKNRIAIVRELAATASVEINRQELQQVLINLLVNAVQAMPDGGSITLQSADWYAGDALVGVRITVQDSGVGIASADLGRVFDPFFTTKKNHGTGLGLSISQAIVRRYGGDLSVTSAPGEGAAFTVSLRSDADYAAAD